MESREPGTEPPGETGVRSQIVTVELSTELPLTIWTEYGWAIPPKVPEGSTAGFWTPSPFTSQKPRRKYVPSARPPKLKGVSVVSAMKP